MTVEFLRQNNSDELTLIFAGWGMSASDFRFLGDVETRRATSLLVCSDYRILDFDMNILAPYANIRLIGYSLGVWAASYVFREKKIMFSEKIALNGTKHPVDNERGIPVKIYEGTEQLLSGTSLQKFFLRMCGTRENFEQFMANTEEKNIPQLKEELHVIQQLSAQYDVSNFQWTKVIISAQDAIFPFENQRKAWRSNVNTVEADAPHFSQSLFTNV
jgi:biotin synthesis protein BioG